MKKYLITALALATLTSCTKDDDKIEDKVEKETPVNQEPIDDNQVKAIVSVSSESIDYEQVDVAATKQISLEVINTGTAKLEITSITLKGTDKSEFSVNGTLTSIEVGKKESIIVNFTPNNTGVRNASLEIVTNVGTKTVTLKGTGKATVAESDRVKKALMDNTWICTQWSRELNIGRNGVALKVKAYNIIYTYPITSISNGFINVTDPGNGNAAVSYEYTLNADETSFVIDLKSGTGNMTFVIQ